MHNDTVHETWSSRMIFILAGGGFGGRFGKHLAFPLRGRGEWRRGVCYDLPCLYFLLAIPINMSELLIGRRGRKSPIASLAGIAKEMKVTPAWRFIGWNGIILSVLVVSFYSVIAGWGPGIYSQDGKRRILRRCS